jgi:hypothetical protein
MMAPVVAGVRVGRYSDECGLEGFASGKLASVPLRNRLSGRPV